METRRITPEEAVVLRKMRTFILVFSIVFAVLSAPFVYFIIVGISGRSRELLLPGIVVTAILAAVDGILFRYAARYAIDIREGIAFIHCGEVTNKYCVRGGCYIVIGGERFGMPTGAFDLAQIGERVEIQYAARSKHSLQMRKTNGDVFSFVKPGGLSR